MRTDPTPPRKVGRKQKHLARRVREDEPSPWQPFYPQSPTYGGFPTGSWGASITKIAVRVAHERVVAATCLRVRTPCRADPVRVLSRGRIPKALALAAPPPLMLGHYSCREAAVRVAKERVVAATCLRVRTPCRADPVRVLSRSRIPKALALAAPPPVTLRNNGHLESPFTRPPSEMRSSGASFVRNGGFARDRGVRRPKSIYAFRYLYVALIFQCPLQLYSERLNKTRRKSSWESEGRFIS